MNFSLKNIIKICSALGLFFSIIHSAHSENSGNNCPANHHGKNSTILLDENGRKIDFFAFDAGEKNISALKNDFIFSKMKYKIMLFPAARKIEDDCSLSTCVKVEKIKSRCANTNEYILSIGINPSRMEAGPFIADVNLKIQTPDGPDLNHAGYSFKEIIKGDLSMPWLSIIQSAELSENIAKLYKNETATVDIGIKNTGTEDYNFGGWKVDSNENEYFQLLPGTCYDVILKPASICAVKIKKTNTKIAKLDVYQWWNSFKNENLKTRLQINKISDTKAEATIYNLE